MALDREKHLLDSLSYSIPKIITHPEMPKDKIYFLNSRNGEKSHWAMPWDKVAEPLWRSSHRRKMPQLDIEIVTKFTFCGATFTLKERIVKHEEDSVLYRFSRNDFKVDTYYITLDRQKLYLNGEYSAIESRLSDILYEEWKGRKTTKEKKEMSEVFDRQLRLRKRVESGNIRAAVEVSDERDVKLWLDVGPDYNDNKKVELTDLKEFRKLLGELIKEIEHELE